MKNRCLVRGRLNIIGLAIVLFFSLAANGSEAQQQVTPTISVTINKSIVFKLAEKVKSVQVSQPAVADVRVVRPNQLLINGKAIGTTSLIIFDAKDDVSYYDLVVAPDLGGLRGQLRTIFPNEKIEIATSGPAIVLKGEVSNETVYDKVLELAMTYIPPKPPAAVGAGGTSVVVTTPKAILPSTGGSNFAGFEPATDLYSPYRFPDKGKIEGIVDLLVIREIRQIELDVIVAEVSMTKAREIGFDFRYTGPTQVQSANSFLGSVSPFLGAPNGAFTYVNGAYSLVSLYRMLQNRDIAEILAQPRLVIKNGRSAGFLAGGEFPIVQTLADTSTVQYKPFGVRLDFVPVITWSDRIDLPIFSEVSEPDGVLVNGFPQLKVNRALSRVELKEGESLIIAGLLKRDIVKDLAKFPMLGDIPILGALFRSTKFSNRETELVFVITPRIVRAMKPGERPQLPSIEKYDDSDMRQVPVPGTGEGKKSMTPGASIP
ncbi:MAG: pil protein [Deltaproteobacteria bacterium]|nr:pil protein [Deltaproteobacteria bacterium]